MNGNYNNSLGHIGCFAILNLLGVIGNVSRYWEEGIIMDKRRELLKEQGIIITGDLDSAMRNLNREFHPVAKRNKKIIKEKK